MQKALFKLNLNCKAMEETVKQRLISYLKYKGISQAKFSESVGLSRGFVNNIANSIQPKTLHRITMQYSDLNKAWLLTGEGEMLNGTPVKHQQSTIGLPLIPIDAMAGALSGVDYSFAEYECEQYVVPVFKGADFLIRVQGDSMMPKYMPGDMVACQKVSLSDIWFQWGKVYVLDTKQGALIKRIEPSEQEGCILICSENERYKPFDMPVHELNGVAMIKGIIRVE